VPRLVEAAGGADVVLGSRYVPGGGVENWALRRRIQSRGGCAYARMILRVPVRDLTGGFKCWNRRALEALDFDGVDAHGYGFQIEMTYRAIKAGLSVTEVPIVFRERREGQSKMTAWITLEAVWKVPALRLRG
jgi:dolichol-phosphate mannosyltransferase